MVSTILSCSAPVLTGLAILLLSVFTLTPRPLALAYDRVRLRPVHP